MLEVKTCPNLDRTARIGEIKTKKSTVRILSGPESTLTDTPCAIMRGNDCRFPFGNEQLVKIQGSDVDFRCIVAVHGETRDHRLRSNLVYQRLRFNAQPKSGSLTSSRLNTTCQYHAHHTGTLFQAGMVKIRGRLLVGWEERR